MTSRQSPYLPEPDAYQLHRANRHYWRTVRSGRPPAPRPEPVATPAPKPCPFEDGLDFTLGA